MALTTRGKVVAGVLGTVLVAGGAVGGFVVLSGGPDAQPSTPIDTDGDGTPDATTTAPPTLPCPLTGYVPADGAPDRPVLAVKIEEAPAARPQAGLNQADVVYEQPVEGNITRLLALFQCRDADRIGPVRSARFMDPNLLPQFGAPLFAFSGAAPPVVELVERHDASGRLVDLSFEGPAVGAYERDPGREMPHNLFTSTAALYGAAGDEGGEPLAAFLYGSKAGKATRATTISLPFQDSIASIEWRWDTSIKKWVRYIGGQPAVDEDGEPITAMNVVVQEVRQERTNVVDAAGNPSYEVIVIDTGAVYVFRNGKMISGTWRKGSPEDITFYARRNGKEIALAPGNTWVELFGNQQNTLHFVPSG